MAKEQQFALAELPQKVFWSHLRPADTENIGLHLRDQGHYYLQCGKLAFAWKQTIGRALFQSHLTGSRICGKQGRSRRTPQPKNICEQKNMWRPTWTTWSSIPDLKPTLPWQALVPLRSRAHGIKWRPLCPGGVQVFLGAWFPKQCDLTVTVKAAACSGCSIWLPFFSLQILPQNCSCKTCSSRTFTGT